MLQHFLQNKWHEETHETSEFDDRCWKNSIDYPTTLLVSQPRPLTLTPQNLKEKAYMQLMLQYNLQNNWHEETHENSGFWWSMMNTRPIDYPANPLQLSHLFPHITLKIFIREKWPTNASNISPVKGHPPKGTGENTWNLDCHYPTHLPHITPL